MAVIPWILLLLVLAANWKFDKFAVGVIALACVCSVLQLVAGVLCVFSPVPWTPPKSLDPPASKESSSTDENSIKQNFLISFVCNLIGYTILAITFGEQIILLVTAVVCLYLGWERLFHGVEGIAKRFADQKLEKSCDTALNTLVIVFIIGGSKLAFAFVAAEVSTAEIQAILSLVGGILSLVGFIFHLVLIFVFSKTLYHAQKCI